MSENIKITVEELRKLISVDNVVGKAIETEDKLLIPVMRMGVGFGVGENILGEDKGGAAGAGAGTAGAGPDMGNAGAAGGHDDDVVDADYKEV